MQREDFKMGQDFFEDIPPEITFEILSRLPAQTVMTCKCVCKPWLNLLATPEFVKSHHSKSVPVLVVFEWQKDPKSYKLIEFVDKVDLDCDEDHWDIVLKFQLPFNKPPLHSSANGVLFLFGGAYHLVLCNPFTRECITVPPPMPYISRPPIRTIKYGFGVSRMSGQYKLVRITVADNPTSPPYGYDQCDCQVYTVGTGLWIRIPSGSPLTDYYSDSRNAFLNGNLHWLAYEGSSFLISCLDLETDIFSTFPYPPVVVALDDPDKYMNLSVLRDRLCVCESLWDEGSSTCDIDIWLLKEYGNEKSWTKEFIIRKVGMDDFLGNICPLKVFKDGSILMASKGRIILFYSSKTNTIQQAILFRDFESVFDCMAFYAPNFLPLKNFEMECVSSY